MKRSLLIGCAVVIDLCVGDPRAMPHPVSWIARMITVTEPVARRIVERETAAGAILTFGVTGISGVAGAIAGSYAATSVVAAASALAIGSLLDHAKRIERELSAGRLDRAREALSLCVGRDTHGLDEHEIARAAIETLAESLCDGIISPLAYLAVFGCSGMAFYKAVNTCDSLIGHIEAPYTRFGRVAARLDDVVNFVPARIAALAIVLAAPAVNGSIVRSARTWLRDGGKHRSPNAGQPEAAMAGALSVRLGGTNSYDGRPVDAPLLGARYSAPRADDVRRAANVVFTASIAAAAVAIALCALIES